MPERPQPHDELPGSALLGIRETAPCPPAHDALRTSSILQREPCRAVLQDLCMRCDVALPIGALGAQPGCGVGSTAPLPSQLVV